MSRKKIEIEQNCCDYCFNEKKENNYANATCYRCGIMSCWKCAKEKNWEEYKASYIGGSSPYLQFCATCHKLVSLQDPPDQLYSLYMEVKKLKEDVDKKYEEWKVRDREIHIQLINLRHRCEH